MGTISVLREVAGAPQVTGSDTRVSFQLTGTPIRQQSLLGVGGQGLGRWLCPQPHRDTAWACAASGTHTQTHVHASGKLCLCPVDLRGHWALCALSMWLRAVSWPSSKICPMSPNLPPSKTHGGALGPVFLVRTLRPMMPEAAGNWPEPKAGARGTPIPT